MHRARTAAAGLASIALGAVACAAVAVAPASVPAEASHAAVARGRNLVAAGDCEACHTAENGAPFAGGRAVPTPFGTLYSTNITPDAGTGIGKWSRDDLYRALHEGIARDGHHLYPAFPYPWYTKVTRSDSDAIMAYLETLAPIHAPPRPNELPWPFSMRSALALWNAAFLDKGEYRWRADKSATWNEGAYLVEGLGHCGACHTPKNVAGAVKHGDALEGGYGEGWYATSLVNDVRDGIGSWSVDDIAEFLATGANAHATAFGPMAEVVRASTSRLTRAQLVAIGTYLKDKSPRTPATAKTPDRVALDRGAGLYIDDCAGCHMSDGRGLANAFPPLAGNAIVQADDPETLVHLILEGARGASTSARPNQFAMPAFDWKMTDDEVASLATFVRNGWGNQASSVSSSQVAEIRRTVEHAENE